MSVLSDPDIKIHMTLDQIIHLEKDQINSQLSWRSVKGFKKRKKQRRWNPDCNDHSVPLLPSTGGVGIYVSKKSSLLNAENRRRISEAFSNRAINSDLIEQTKQVIPAEYKLVRTINGVERVLVPTAEHSRSLRQKLVAPRKLNKGSASNLSLSEKPPPLIQSLIYSPAKRGSLKMDVDDSDNEISILENPEPVKVCGVVDQESNSSVDLLEGKPSSGPNPIVMPAAYGLRSLNDRFTMLTGRLRF